LAELDARIPEGSRVHALYQVQHALVLPAAQEPAVVVWEVWAKEVEGVAVFSVDGSVQQASEGLLFCGV